MTNTDQILRNSTPAGIWARCRGDLLPIGCLIATWVAAVLFVDPRGNFPLVDDWAYLLSLRELRQGGDLVLSNWTAANLVSQLLWALPFTIVLPPDYETARLATLVAAGLAGPGLYATLRLAGARRSTSLLFTAALLFNPIFFFLSFTFMTDIYYTALQVLASLFITVALSRRRNWPFIFGWLIGIVALLSRQVALAIPIAYGGAVLTTRRWTAFLLSTCAAFIVSFLLIQCFFKTYLTYSGKLPALYNRQSNAIISMIEGPLLEIIKSIVYFSEVIFFYLGVMSAPALIVAISVSFANRGKRAYTMAMGLVGLLALGSFGLLVFGQHKLMPFIAHVLAPWGLGDDLAPDHWSSLYQIVLTIVAAFGGGTLVLAAFLLVKNTWYYFVSMHREEKSRVKTSLIIYFGFLSLILLAPMFFIPIRFRFDRYLLPVLASFFVLIVVGFDLTENGSRPSRNSFAFASIWVGASLVASVVFMHDYFVARRVEWQALQTLIAGGVKPENVDAGWVFNGSYSYGKFGDPKEVIGWYERGDFKISLKRELGYTVVRQLPVPGWAPWTRHWAVLVMSAPNR